MLTEAYFIELKWAIRNRTAMFWCHKFCGRVWRRKKKLILFYWTVIEFSGISTLVLLQRRERYRWCVRHVGSLMIAELTFCASG